ncbi:MAG TPA: DUF2203 domain-containing protein [Terriglobales bacterium]|nr:DUF2203 domain-containing protein [Terriglobales bacterium]
MEPGDSLKARNKKDAPNRTFTLTQAQQMIPVLSGLLRGALRNKARVQKINEEFKDLSTRIMVNGGIQMDIGQYSRLKAEREKLLQQVKDALAEITATGVQVKDLDIGLLDFPCEVNNEIILLCWKLGERQISHWHGLEEGYAGRKRIDDRMLKADARRAKH